jgi:Glycosyltransferase sugar-binding region containing DXD motif
VHCDVYGVCRVRAEDTSGDGLPILQYWHASEIPEDVAGLLASFRDLNPTLRHRVFDAVQAEELIAGHFTDREVRAFRSCAVPSMQSDYFRFCAVLAHGGIYSDADFGCRSSLLPLIETMDEGILFEHSNGHATSGFFAFQHPGHPLLRLALDVATLNLERRIGKRPDVLVGPWVFTSLTAIHKLGSLEATRQRFGGDSMQWLFDAAVEVVGDYDALATAFDGVRIAPFDSIWQWIAKPGKQLAYKSSDDHWVRWVRQGRPIFK